MKLQLPPALLVKGSGLIGDEWEARLASYLSSGAASLPAGEGSVWGWERLAQCLSRWIALPPPEPHASVCGVGTSTRGSVFCSPFHWTLQGQTQLL